MLGHYYNVPTHPESEHCSLATNKRRLSPNAKRQRCQRESRQEIENMARSTTWNGDSAFFYIIHATRGAPILQVHVQLHTRHSPDTRLNHQGQRAPPPTLRLPAAAPALPTSTGTAHICDTWTSQAAHTIPTVPSPAPGAGHLGLPARCHTGPLIDPHATTSSCYRCCARSGQSSYRTSLLALRLPHHKAIHAHVISFSPPRARQTGTGRSR